MFVTRNKQRVEEIENPVTKIGHSKFLDSFYLKINKHIGEEIENTASKTSRPKFQMVDSEYVVLISYPLRKHCFLKMYSVKTIVVMSFDKLVIDI